MSDSPYRIITRGVAAWNQWRQDHPGVKPSLDAAQLAGADLSGCDLDDVVLFEANLEGTNLARAQLRGAVLQGACLRSANLTRANLANADLGGTFNGDLLVPLAFPDGADLRNALVHETVFVNSSLDGVDLRGARFRSVVLANVDLSNAQGLDEVVHETPSEVTVSTLYRCKGERAMTFLASAGVPASLLARARDLAGTDTTEFQSCFISHSSEDRAFVEKLYKRLREEDVYAYYSEEHTRAGLDWERELRDAVKGKRFVLVVSESAKTRRNVRKEIRWALEADSQTWAKHEVVERVILPIRLGPPTLLDDWRLEWGEVDVAERLRWLNMIDFSGWEDPDTFEHACRRLLNGLRNAGLPWRA